MEKTFTIPKDKNKPANMNGVLTKDTDYIIRCLNKEIDKYIDFKVEIEGTSEKLSS